MAAMNTLECILTVLNSCQERPDLFVGLESKLLPMLHRLLHPSGDGIEVGEKLFVSLVLCVLSLSCARAKKRCWRGGCCFIPSPLLALTPITHPCVSLSAPPLFSPFLLISSATTTAAPRERVPNSRLAHVHDTTAALFPALDSF